jgi:hypothetical protein
MVEIKGSTVREAVAAYRAHRRDECQQVLAALDPKTRALIEDVQPNEWLPLEAFVRYLQAQVDVTGEDARTLHTRRAELVVERQLHGIYKVFAKLASPQALISRLTALNSTYWRGVEVERRLEGKTRAVLRYSGFEAGHRLMEPILVGFFRKALEVNGARDVKAEFTVPIGGPGPAELVVTWS